MKNPEPCFQCGQPGAELFGYPICETCKAQLGLFTDATIQKHIAGYQQPGRERTYEQEIQYRLEFMEKDYIKKRIKLLYIQERVRDLK